MSEDNTTTPAPENTNPTPVAPAEPTPTPSEVVPPAPTAAPNQKAKTPEDQLAEKLDLTTNYISTVERGASFPRCEKLILLLNGLETSADAVFCGTYQPCLADDAGKPYQCYPRGQ